MALYRIKQFIWGIESYFKDIDNDYLEIFLNENEILLFNKLRQNDKHHSIRVCKEAISILKSKKINVDVNKLAKAALLHDVGKGEYGLNLIEKSILVMLNRVTNGKIKKYKNIKHIDIYYNHPEKGAEVLKQFNIYDKEFLDTIRYHHSSDKREKNILLDIIRESDNKN